MLEQNGSCPYSPRKMEALTALCDTILPSLEVPADENQLDESIVQYYRTSASMAGTPYHFAVLLGEKTSHPKQFLSNLALLVLSTRVGTFIICGRKSLSAEFPYLQKFSRVSPEKRQHILLSWSDSWFVLLRILYAALKIFTHLLFFTQVNENGENVSWKAIGYNSPVAKRIKNVQQLGDPVPKKEEEDHFNKEEQVGHLEKGVIKLTRSREKVFEQLCSAGFPASLLYPSYNLIRSPSASFVVKCDAVVVGSGSGGGVVAGVLAKAGYKVLVLEKGKYLASHNFPLLEGQAMDQMYLGNGIVGTANMEVLVLAGSTVGGGSTINWSASIRTPDHVRKEWSNTYGLKVFESKAYDEALDAVCHKMGVQSGFEKEGFNNMILRKGCENLDCPVETIPRNASSDHYCGFCCFGCKDRGKKGVTETWLVDMIESGNGAILPECEAVKVITREKQGRNCAVGVGFMFKNNHGLKEYAIIESKVTVVACGAICTPPLLKRSGLKNPNIGRNLRLHPVVFGWGYFPEGPDMWPEPENKCYEGAIMTAMSKAVWNPDNSGYGAIIQTPSLHPGMCSALLPWHSGLQTKKHMRRFSRTAHIFALGRDRGSGNVISPTHISYNLADSDEESLRRGMEKVLRILAAAGAEEIGTQHNSGRVLKVKEASDEEIEAFVKEESSRPFKNLSSPICSAHQMGSCRMGVEPKGSAVSPRGETWEVAGLYVADTSVFPTALGVNPMVTVQAIAYCTAQAILESLGGWRQVEEFEKTAVHKN